MWTTIQQRNIDYRIIRSLSFNSSNQQNLNLTFNRLFRKECMFCLFGDVLIKDDV